MYGSLSVNEKRRGRLQDALNMLNSVTAIVESVCDSEQDCMDNYPENLQGTEKYERMESAVDRLNDALENIEEVKGYIQSALG